MSPSDVFQNLTRLQKILLAVDELSTGTTAGVKFEDIVVKVFKRYPTEFKLRGYPEYPDSGDVVHKPLYDAKKKGLVTAGNKIFSLTEKGLAFVQEIKGAVSGKKVRSNNRLSRYAEKEVSRVAGLEGFRSIFLSGDTDKLLDTDFYNYLGVSVQTKKNDFIGRVKTMEAVIDEISKLPKEAAYNGYKKIIDYHALLMSRYKDELQYKIAT